MYVVSSLFIDVGENVLRLAQRNVMQNTRELELAGSVRVRELDWKRPLMSTSMLHILYSSTRMKRE